MTTSDRVLDFSVRFSLAPGHPRVSHCNLHVPGHRLPVTLSGPVPSDVPLSLFGHGITAIHNSRQLVSAVSGTRTAHTYTHSPLGSVMFIAALLPNTPSRVYARLAGP